MKQQVLTQLAPHRGRAQAVSMPALAACCGLSTRVLQAVVHDLILDGHLICSGTCGYWLPENDAEVQATVRNLRARAMSCLQRVAAIEQISLRQVVAQMELDYAGEFPTAAHFREAKHALESRDPVPPICSTTNRLFRELKEPPHAE